MQCTDQRILMSARLDGETTTLEDEAVDAHLTQCAACRQHLVALESVTRRVGVGAVPEIPDQSAAIMAAMTRPSTLRTDVLRAVIAGIGFTKVASSLAVLFAGLSASGGTHSGTDLAALDIAIGAVLLLVAWQPRRAAALAPVLALVAVAGVIAATAAIATGTDSLARELFHLVDIVAAALVWLLAAPQPGRRRTTAVTA